MIRFLGIHGGMIPIIAHPGGDFIIDGTHGTVIIIMGGMILITGPLYHILAVMDIIVIIIPVIIILTIIRHIPMVHRKSDAILAGEAL